MSKEAFEAWYDDLELPSSLSPIRSSSDLQRVITSVAVRLLFLLLMSF